MKKLLDTRPTDFFDYDRAKETAKLLQAGDPDWSYRVVKPVQQTGTPWHVQVTDEEGRLVGFW